jgi:hypothetical protein
VAPVSGPRRSAPSLRVRTLRPPWGCPRRTPERRGATFHSPHRGLHPDAASASNRRLSATEFSQRPAPEESAAQCFSFSPGTVAATSHPGARTRRRCWGPGAWRELLRGRGRERRVEGWAAVTAAGERQLKWVGGWGESEGRRELRWDRRGQRGGKRRRPW